MTPRERIEAAITTLNGLGYSIHTSYNGDDWISGIRVLSDLLSEHHHHLLHKVNKLYQDYASINTIMANAADTPLSFQDELREPLNHFLLTVAEIKRVAGHPHHNPQESR